MRVAFPSLHAHCMRSTRFQAIWRHPLSAVADSLRHRYDADVLRLDRCQVALAVDRFVEHPPAAYYGLWPLGIHAFVAIGGDLRSAGELAEVASGDFRIGVVERVEWESHGRTESSMQ